MTEYAIQKYGRLPLVFAGGVMSDKIIKNKITAVYGDAKFAEPAFSCDNASGVAIFGYLKQVKINGCTDCCSD
jgi:N6-L-threonylcarbamoyladenine synthase